MFQRTQLGAITDKLMETLDSSIVASLCKNVYLILPTYLSSVPFPARSISSVVSLLQTCSQARCCRGHRRGSAY